MSASARMGREASWNGYRERGGDEMGGGGGGRGESLILKSTKKEEDISVKRERVAHCHSFDERSSSARVRSVCSTRRLLFSRRERDREAR